MKQAETSVFLRLSNKAVKIHQILKKIYIDDLAAILAGELGYCYFIGKKKKKTLIRQKYERYFESSLLTSIITFLCRGMF